MVNPLFRVTLCVHSSEATSETDPCWLQTGWISELDPRIELLVARSWQVVQEEVGAFGVLQPRPGLDAASGRRAVRALRTWHPLMSDNAVTPSTLRVSNRKSSPFRAWTADLLNGVRSTITITTSLIVADYHQRVDGTTYCYSHPLLAQVIHGGR